MAKTKEMPKTNRWHGGMAAMNRRYYLRRDYRRQNDAKIESFERVAGAGFCSNAVPDRELRTDQELYYDGEGVEFAPHVNVPLTRTFRR